MSPRSKLRRLARGDGDGDDWNGKMSPDWASLQMDLVELIGWRVLTTGDLHDYVRFRAVCSHWSASTARPGGRGVLDPRFHPRRWMMLPEGHGLYPGHPSLRGFVRFVNLDTGAFARARLPLLADHVILDSVDGLLLLHRNDDDTSAVRLLHPFTGDPPCADADGDGQPRLPLPVKIAECPKDILCFVLHFVEWCSELLVVSYSDVSFSKLLVYRLADLIIGKIEPLTDIGEPHIVHRRSISMCLNLT